MWGREAFGARSENRRSTNRSTFLNMAQRLDLWIFNIGNIGAMQALVWSQSNSHTTLLHWCHCFTQKHVSDGGCRSRQSGLAFRLLGSWAFNCKLILISLILGDTTGNNSCVAVCLDNLTQETALPTQLEDTVPENVAGMTWGFWLRCRQYAHASTQEAGRHCHEAHSTCALIRCLNANCLIY
jgi:hypothetical protein